MLASRLLALLPPRLSLVSFSRKCCDQVRDAHRHSTRSQPTLDSDTGHRDSTRTRTADTPRSCQCSCTCSRACLQSTHMTCLQHIAGIGSVDRWRRIQEQLQAARKAREANMTEEEREARQAKVTTRNTALRSSLEKFDVSPSPLPASYTPLAREHLSCAHTLSREPTFLCAPAHFACTVLQPAPSPSTPIHLLCAHTPLPLTLFPAHRARSAHVHTAHVRTFLREHPPHGPRTCLRTPTPQPSSVLLP